MALYALDQEQCIFAEDANSKSIYFCLDCRSVVKLRRPPNRVAHFYHLRKTTRCSLHGKSEDHLLLQLQLQKRLLPARLTIEKPFFPIRRIADVAWDEKKLVFEIQCSPISLPEAKQRVADYRKIGYEIIWLLDDRIFNQRTARPAELFLRGQTSYFFSFDRFGSTTLYDQLERFVQYTRCTKPIPFVIDVTKHYSAPPTQNLPQSVPSQIRNRLQFTRNYFYKDLVYSLFHSPPPVARVFAEWAQQEELCKKRQNPLRAFFALAHQYAASLYQRYLTWLVTRGAGS